MGLQRDLVRALDDSSECAFLVGPEQKILSWNPAAEELLGRPRSEALGARCHELIAGRVAGREWCRPHCAVWRSLQRGRRVKSFDLLTHGADGQQVWVNVSLLVLRHEEGPFTLEGRSRQGGGGRASTRDEPAVAAGAPALEHSQAPPSGSAGRTNSRWRNMR